MRWAAKHWLPMDVIPDLGDRFFMLLSATGRDAAPVGPALELVEKVRVFNPSAEFWALGSDHSLTSCRPLLRELVIDFIKRKL